MKLIFSILALNLAALSVAHADDKDTQVRAAIETFYKNFNEGFTAPADYATEDWSHINLNGGRNQGGGATLAGGARCIEPFSKAPRKALRAWPSDTRRMM